MGTITKLSSNENKLLDRFGDVDVRAIKASQVVTIKINNYTIELNQFEAQRLSEALAIGAKYLVKASEYL